MSQKLLRTKLRVICGIAIRKSLYICIDKKVYRIDNKKDIGNIAYRFIMKYRSQYEPKLELTSVGTHVDDKFKEELVTRSILSRFRRLTEDYNTKIEYIPIDIDRLNEISREFNMRQIDTNCRFVWNNIVELEFENICFFFSILKEQTEFFKNSEKYPVTVYWMLEQSIHSDRNWERDCIILNRLASVEWRPMQIYPEDLAFQS